MSSTHASFDPNGMGIKGNLFGLPYSSEDASLVILPVPWQVTVSYGSGTAQAPAAILDASSQIDLLHSFIKEAWKTPVTMGPISDELYQENVKLRELAESHIRKMENGLESESDKVLLSKVNDACENLNIYIKNTCSRLLKENKIVGLLGGDHSTPIGYLRALAEKYDRFGILQIDAHADLRKAYEGFTYSHASIMYNALKLPGVGRLVQVGIRDYCEEEKNVMERSMGRVKTFFDADLKSAQYNGITWAETCSLIIKELPNLVYISFDIDGLDPKLCPHTGTPVPGGLEFAQVTFLLKEIVRSGRRIIGFDLCEVAPGAADDWDANVGARALWELTQWTYASHHPEKLSAAI